MKGFQYPPQYQWHWCCYQDGKLFHDGAWKDGKWYEWLDKYDNRETARMKLDMIDHFFPCTKRIEEAEIIAFRELLEVK